MKTLLFLLISINLYAKDIVVFEIDSGVDVSHSQIAKHVNKADNILNSENYIDQMGHGTHIAGLILNHVCPEVKLISCKFINHSGDNDADTKMVNCLERAIIEKPDFINISAGGTNPIDLEYNAMKRIPQNIKIIVAAGNEHSDLKKYGYYPASYNLINEIIVGALSEDYKRLPESNYGRIDMVWEVGEHVLSTLQGDKWGYKTGTSQATAIHTNKLLLEECRKIGSIPRDVIK